MKHISAVYNPAFTNIASKLNQTELLKDAAQSLNIQLDFFTCFDINTNQDKTKLPFKSNTILFLDKNIALAQWLESVGLRVINSSIAINNADNKALSHAVLAQHPTIKQIPTLIGPQNFRLAWYPEKLEQFIEQIKRCFQFPVIVKSIYGSFGDYVFLCKDEQKLRQTLSGLTEQIIVQQYIATSNSEAVRVIVVNNQVVGALHTQNEGDFRSNLNKGAVGEPYQLSQEETKLAITISQAMQLFYCGIDFLFDQDRSLIFCEVNSNVQLTKSSMYLKTNLAIQLLASIA
ncbi:RimK family alpha-L-glutamate ligase [Mycoplasmoides pneumoniae]|uniref:Uncharacterized protein MG012 homolog n=4 Tax=Mycoplasmoides pneumoniae TaxID=2104 RepID=Y016_MYCPN|nr:RimK family alpha-L-glutamate ligase [Mycoplasmoides pneumoniae]P75097.1 RecName: Full=Uncharacterized protein MG012 homolog [Mycoplasmoides pneumoniae M129]AAB95786.1 ribosomal S6 modification protein-like [Mycoplasmoides pneumoniae M129]ADK86758.1 alpha-L-glutamate ligase, RimK family [Mycoplasmoides pneumoniae FH]AGC03960.1 hypothetical protein C985_0016 [Mycoplasmoides pneumoniae M129-B7]ALA29893.1 hypothetical protein C897_00085 [Mycoplasmoides pneumoniae PI 1428]ALA30865.1 hypothetic